MKPGLDWSGYEDAGLGDAYADIPRHGGNFAKAVAACINSRKCEATGRGVMCPSFRVTGNPDLSTGGRVRLLKAVLNNDDPGALVADQRLAQTMDLCVGCKGCRRECENAVDMSMIKVEVMAQRHRRSAPSLRTRLFAGLPGLLDRHPALRYLILLRNRVPLLARLAQRWIGISAGLRLPEPVARPYLQRHAEVAEGPREPGQPEVVLLIDSFSNHFAPNRIAAARTVLERSGYRVHIARPRDRSTAPLCCGRTQLANGMIDDARESARRMLDALTHHVDQGRLVIGLEPSCLLAIRDDYQQLGLGDKAKRVGSASLLFEEFIARELKAKRFNAVLEPVRTKGQPVLVHGHCHQKAVGAMKSMRRVLQAIPDLEFEMIEASCCGMAGSFGFEAEHAGLAMAMAEQDLLPALRAKPAARVLCNGWSCGQQIAHGTARSTVHIAELLAEALD